MTPQSKKPFILLITAAGLALAAIFAVRHLSKSDSPDSGPSSASSIHRPGDSDFPAAPAGARNPVELRKLHDALPDNYWLEELPDEEGNERARAEKIRLQIRMDELKQKVKANKATEQERIEYYKFLKKITKDRIALLEYHLKKAQESRDQDAFTPEDLVKAEKTIELLRRQIVEYEKKIL